MQNSEPQNSPVALERTIARGDPECRVVVYLQPGAEACEGARYGVTGRRPLVLLKLKQPAEANKKFGELTRQVETLEAEVARRVRAEKKLMEAGRRKDEFPRAAQSARAGDVQRATAETCR